MMKTITWDDIRILSPSAFNAFVRSDLGLDNYEPTLLEPFGDETFITDEDGTAWALTAQPINDPDDDACGWDPTQENWGWFNAPALIPNQTSR